MTHKIFMLVFTLIFVTLFSTACGFNILRGSGNLVSESRNVSDFDQIALSGSGEVIITQGEGESLSVETDDNIMPYIKAEVRDNTLYLGFDRQVNLVSPTRLSFNVRVRDLEAVSVSGSGEVTVDSLESDSLDIDVSGSGEVLIDALTTEQVEVDIGGSGEVEIAGETIKQDVSIGGSGKYKAGDLYSEIATISIGGSGEATVWVSESLEADIGGSGDIAYYGQPGVSSSVGGSGKVESLGGK